MFDLSLNERRALVCGSTQGIGLAIARELADLGAELVLCARDESALKASISNLSSDAGQKHTYVTADFSRPAHLKSQVAAYLNSADPINILVNNTAGPKPGEIAEANPEDFVQAFEQHLLCNHTLAQLLIPAMKQAHFGRIINVVSTSVREPIRGLGVSNTIRGAVASWAKTLATELGPHGITVNNILPGFTNTQRIEALISSKALKAGKDVASMRKEMEQSVPVGRFAEPQEIAYAACFLASSAASYISGVSLAVDGGRLACI